MAKNRLGISARSRLAICGVVGVAAGILTVQFGYPRFAVIVGWDTAALLFVSSVLITVLGYDARTTKQHALRDNPGRAAGDALLLAASVASLFGVGVLVSQAGNDSGAKKLIDIGVGLLSVIIAWGVIHTTYMLTYARLYYGEPEGGVDFNGEAPGYMDFAYLAFILGMTFQVSDTSLTSKAMRASVLRHALLSYPFGAVIIASAINFVVSLGQ